MGQLRNETKGIQLESRPTWVMGRPRQAAQVRLGEVQPLIRQVVDRIFVMFCKENAMTSLHCVRVPCKHDLVCLAPLLTDVLPGCLWPNLINLGRQAPQPQQKCCIHFCKWHVFEPHFWDENIYVYPIYIYEHPYIYTSMCTIIKTYNWCVHKAIGNSFTAHAEKQCASNTVFFYR